MVAIKKNPTDSVWQLLATIPDPEIPVVNICEMGMVRDVKIEEEKVEVSISPTYTACPAMGIIAADIKQLLHSQGMYEVEVKTIYHPAWTTDLLSNQVKEKLKNYGIAPPVDSNCMNWLHPDQQKISCPHCGSTSTRLVSQFGSTPCKSHYQCHDCLEPFDYFKCH
jgi:ring-1,2-phenylacetyl-CoA epoxidase subunit PaaD